MEFSKKACFSGAHEMKANTVEIYTAKEARN
jgi:hypothetical protein